uniref:Uncharacterized protein n=1 Tax=Micrurus corallinus TaxID=54390 RepID=A0A2D4F177_MICCO
MLLGERFRGLRVARKITGSPPLITVRLGTEVAMAPQKVTLDFHICDTHSNPHGDVIHIWMSGNLPVFMTTAVSQGYVIILQPSNESQWRSQVHFSTMLLTAVIHFI